MLRREIGVSPNLEGSLNCGKPRESPASPQLSVTSVSLVLETETPTMRLQGVPRNEPSCHKPWIKERAQMWEWSSFIKKDSGSRMVGRRSAAPFCGMAPWDITSQWQEPSLSWGYTGVTQNSNESSTGGWRDRAQPKTQLPLVTAAS